MGPKSRDKSACSRIIGMHDYRGTSHGYRMALLLLLSWLLTTALASTTDLLPLWLLLLLLRARKLRRRRSGPNTRCYRAGDPASKRIRIPILHCSAGGRVSRRGGNVDIQSTVHQKAARPCGG